MMAFAADGAKVTPVPGRCYGLALSGGGDRGAYEAGVLKGLVQRIPDHERTWHVVTGISAGSILTSGSGLFDVGDEQSMVEFLIDTVTNFSRAGVIEDWPLGEIQGLLSESGLFNSAPLRKSLTNVLTSHGMWKDRRLVIGATSDTTGRFVTWNETLMADKGIDAVVSVVMASAAWPGVLPAINYDGDTYSDGGATMGVNVFDAVERCRELVDRDQNITIDIVATAGPGPGAMKPIDAHRDHTLTILERTKQIQDYNKAYSDVVDAKLAYPHVNWRFFIYPNETFPGDGLDFNATEMEQMVQVGIADALNAKIAWW